MAYSKEFYKSLYFRMLRIRICEESLVEPILKGVIKCPCHLYSGEEAIAVGVCANLDDEDVVFGTHRSHGHYLAKGGDIKELIAEIYCKETGCSKGRGGSMHLISPEIGFLGSAPIVAGTISLAMGAALSFHIKGEENVAVTFFGDGAAGEGVMYESLNFAAIHKLPIIFVCENNFYSTHMPIKEIRSSEVISDVARTFNIQTLRENGNDVLKVYEASKEAVDLCRKGNGPFFLEFTTYRLRGHVGPDDNIQGSHTDIRPKDEVEAWKKRDPIMGFEGVLLESGVLTEEELAEIKKDIETDVSNAHASAMKADYPNTGEIKHYVFK